MGRRIATAPVGNLRLRHRAFACALCAMLVGAAQFERHAFAQAPHSSREPARKNWYGDPFFPLSAAAGASCPAPLGPRTTRAEADDDAHYRVERGTSCWLAHRCSKPSSYMYDSDIAAAIRKRLHDAPILAGTSVWITVQRRFVYADGCVPADFDRQALQLQLQAVDDVERVFVRVTSDPHAMLPYPTPTTPSAHH